MIFFVNKSGTMHLYITIRYTNKIVRYRMWHVKLDLKLYEDLAQILFTDFIYNYKITIEGKSQFLKI